MITSYTLIGSGTVKEESYPYYTQLFYDFQIANSMDFVINEKIKPGVAPEIESVFWNSSQKQRITDFIFTSQDTLTSEPWFKKYITDRKNKFSVWGWFRYSRSGLCGVTSISVENHQRIYGCFSQEEKEKWSFRIKNMIYKEILTIHRRQIITFD